MYHQFRTNTSTCTVPVCRYTGCNINGLSHWLRAKDTHNIMLYFLVVRRVSPGAMGRRWANAHTRGYIG